MTEMPRPDHIQFTDAKLARRLQELAREGETPSNTAKRLLNEYVAALDGISPDLVEAQRRYGAALQELHRSSDALVVATMQALQEPDS